MLFSLIIPFDHSVCNSSVVKFQIPSFFNAMFAGSFRVDFSSIFGDLGGGGGERGEKNKKLYANEVMVCITSDWL